MNNKNMLSIIKKEFCLFFLKKQQKAYKNGPTNFIALNKKLKNFGKKKLFYT